MRKLNFIERELASSKNSLVVNIDFTNGRVRAFQPLKNSQRGKLTFFQEPM